MLLSLLQLTVVSLFLIRPFATVLLFRNGDITKDATVLLPFAIFGGC